MRGLGIKGAHFKGAADYGADFTQRFEFTAGTGLDQQIAKRGRFDRASDDMALAGVCGDLVEQRIARATADDVNDLDGLPSDLFEAREDILVFQSEAFQNATGEFAY